MKKFIFFTLFTLTISGLFYSNQNANTIKPTPSLSETDTQMLIYMREEEKLAHDVYEHFYNKYQYVVFSNIMKSEQTHMDRVLVLLNQYNIPDPAATESGVFKNKELQTLYNQLIEQGNKSLVEALKVGATIEDVDIKDLKEYTQKTTNTAIINVFENLTCGSRNHMRAFVNSLQANNATYTPQFIDVDTYTAIIDGNHEKCGQMNGMNQGNGKKGKGKKGTGNKRMNNSGTYNPDCPNRNSKL